MKLGLPAKLGILIVVVFGLLLAGFFVYEPVMFIWYRHRIASTDKGIRDGTVDILIQKNKKTFPYIHSWLASRDPRLVDGSLAYLEKTDSETWKKFLPDIGRILDSDPSPLTAKAAKLYFNRKYKTTNRRIYSTLIWQIAEDFKKKPQAQLNILMYIISTKPGGRQFAKEISKAAIFKIGYLKNVRALPVLVELLETADDEGMLGDVAFTLGKLGCRNAAAIVRPLLDRIKTPAMLNEVISALAELGDLEAVGKFIEIASGKKSYTAEHAMWALREIARKLPPGAPQIDVEEDPAAQLEKARELKKWIDANLDRLEWNRTEDRFEMK